MTNSQEPQEPRGPKVPEGQGPYGLKGPQGQAPTTLAQIGRIDNLRLSFKKAKEKYDGIHEGVYTVNPKDRYIIQDYLLNDLMRVEIQIHDHCNLPKGVYHIYDYETESTYFYFYRFEVQLDKLRFVIKENTLREIVHIDTASEETLMESHNDSLYKLAFGLDTRLTFERDYYQYDKDKE